MTSKYVRLTRTGRSTIQSDCSLPISTAFVDPVMSSPATAAAIDHLLLGATSVLSDVDLVVVRLPMDAVDNSYFEAASSGLVESLRAGRFGSVYEGTLAGLAFAPGRSPVIVPEAPVDRLTLLAGLRELELGAILHYGHAVWTLGDAHFRLPNGRHSDTFVRVESALQTPRDVEVLADWTAVHLADSSGLVLDSSALLSVASRLDALSRSAGFGPIKISALPKYPSRYEDVSDVVEDALIPGGDGQLISLISVSSSGRITKHLEKKFRDVGVSTSGIHILVDRSKAERTDPTFSLPGRSMKPNIWLAMPNPDAQDGDDCADCANAARARVVLIDPRTYEAFPYPIPSLVDLDEIPMYVNRPLLRLSSATQAIDVGTASTETDAPRDRQRMGVRFDYTRLYDTDVAVVGNAIRESVHHIELMSERDPEIAYALDAIRATEVVVVRGSEFAGDRGHRIAQARRLVLDELGLGNVETVALRSASGELFVEAADQATIKSRRITLLHVGLVTGWNARRGLEMLTSMGIEPSAISALVMHARPESGDVWRSVRDLFRGRCLSLWHTPLPWSSPLEDERRLLERFIREVPDAAAEPFIAERLRLAETGWSPSGDHQSSLLWSDRLDDMSTTSSSPFGSRLDASSAFAAAGSAVGTARYRTLSSRTPGWMAIDIRRLAVERYDVLSFAGVLRWLRPGEAWWGSSPDQVRQTAQLVADYAGASEMPLLALCELLLASAQGKVPAEAREVFAHAATAIPEPSPSLVAVDHLLKWVRSTS